MYYKLQINSPSSPNIHILFSFIILTLDLTTSEIRHFVREKQHNCKSSFLHKSIHFIDQFILLFYLNVTLHLF